MGCGGSKAVAAVQPLDDEVLQVTKFDHNTENDVKTGENGIRAEGNGENGIRAAENGFTPDRIPDGGQATDQPDTTSTTLNSSSSPAPAAPTELQPVQLQANGSSAVAFEIPLESGESLIQRHPPKRFTRLEDNQLTLEIFHGKHEGAAERRSKLLNKRVQSARVRNLRSAGRAKSRTTMRSDDEPIEGGMDDREHSAEMVS